MTGFGVDRGSGSSAGNPDSTIPESLIDAKGDLIVGTADNTAARLAVGANETRLVADSAQSAGMKWVADTTNYAIAAKGDILVGTAADTVTALTAGADYTRLAARAGATNGVEWVADTQNAVVTTKGDILVATANRTITRLPVGADGKALVADSTQTEGVLWSDVPTNTSPHRQTQLSGALDSSGLNATLSAGAGLNFNVDATPTNAIYTFAGGFNAAGASDLVTVLSADASNQGSLNASNTHYIHATRTSASAVTWGQALVPPQYGYAFSRPEAALLNFEGSDAATTMIDDFGNTWTAAANAQLDTAQSKFGTASLLLDGTGDYIESTNFTSLGSGSWELSCWFRLNATSGIHSLISAQNATGFGAFLAVDHNAGNRRLYCHLSSNGTSNDVQSAGVGSTTTIALSTWYKVRLVFDALAGTYRMYLSNNGAAESQEFSLSSTTRICAITRITIGQTSQAGPVNFNGWVDAARLLRCATATAAETPSVSAPAITDYPVHFFSIPAMTMYEVTAASASGGTDPTMTARTRLFVGECDTNGSAVTAMRNYALRGQIKVAQQTLATISNYSVSHNVGAPSTFKMFLECLSPDIGYTVGDVLQIAVHATDTAVYYGISASVDRLKVYLATITNLARVQHKTSNSPNNLTFAKWRCVVVVAREF